MPPRHVGALDPASLAWPDETDAASDSLEANHYYMSDVRFAGWDDVESVLQREREILPLLDASSNPQAEWELQCELIAGQAHGVADEFFTSLDPGIASAALSLGAAGCIPFWSCNGGVFGGAHSSNKPLVKFFARPSHVALLSTCAERANVDLVLDEYGRCAVVADDLTAMRAFALTMSQQSAG